MTKVIHHAREMVRPLVRPSVKGWQRGAAAVQAHWQPLTASLRLLPDFIILGAQKSGTTTLYTQLSKHPNVAPALTKEVHFFDAAYGKGLNWYRGHFPSVLYRRYVEQIHGQPLLTGEASPYYLVYPHAPRRISETLPGVKLIVLLRNPVDRAYSHYHHQVTRGRELLSFEDALAAEPDRLRGELDKIMADGDYTGFNHVHFSYMARGVYAPQLRAWFEVFPREQFLILNSERFFADPAAAFQQTLAFLNLPDVAAEEVRRRNVGRYQKMKPTTRACLVEYFKPHNQELYELLGETFEWDK